MYEQSHRDYLRSGYLHHRLPVMGCDHYRDNAITYKAQRQKCQRIRSWRTRQLLTCRCVSACCCAWCKIHEGVSWMLKLKMMLCVMMLPLSPSVAHQSSLSVSAWSTTLPAWIMQLPRLADTAERDYFRTSERGLFSRKNNWRTQKYVINEQCR